MLFPGYQATALGMSMMRGGMPTMPMMGCFPGMMPYGTIPNPMIPYASVAALTPSPAMIVQQQQMAMMQCMQQFQVQLQQQMQRGGATKEGAQVPALIVNQTIGVPTTEPTTEAPIREVSHTKPQELMWKTAVQQELPQPQPPLQVELPPVQYLRPHYHAQHPQDPVASPRQIQHQVEALSMTQHRQHLPSAVVHPQSQPQQRAPALIPQQPQEVHQDQQYQQADTQENHYHPYHQPAELRFHQQQQQPEQGTYPLHSSPQLQEALTQPSLFGQTQTADRDHLQHPPAQQHCTQLKLVQVHAEWAHQQRESAHYGAPSLDHAQQTQHHHQHLSQQHHHMQPQGLKHEAPETQELW
jgi:hypothetical protein